MNTKKPLEINWELDIITPVIVEAKIITSNKVEKYKIKIPIKIEKNNHINPNK